MADIQLADAAKPFGPIKTATLEVFVDDALCIGAGTCLAIAPQTFNLDSDAKAVILDTIKEESDDAILDAARGCPVAAIIVSDANGNRLFPQ